MKEIQGAPKNLKGLLLNTKYTIHYYQREYMWGRKQIEELVEDLTSEFLLYYDADKPRESVKDYGTYFMGSIVLTGRENAIIDGQQRLTSLTLLLMYLRKRIKEIGEEYNTIDGMIYSQAFGKKSFNIDVEEREECLDAIFNDKDFNYTGNNESIKNIWSRYNDIEEIFSDIDINDMALLYFIDWLIERVFFIEIVATTEQDAHKVFVSMNDRGLSLTPTEMLKGYLLSEISDDNQRLKANNIWKDKIALLKNIDKSEDEAFIKNWLRAQYAQTIRDTKAGAENKDFDIIGTGFHKWVRDNKSMIGLQNSADYINLINEFSMFCDLYLIINQYESSYNEEFKYIYYNAQLGFTLQTMLLLAPICVNDDVETIKQKLILVSKFIDLLIYTRVINYKSCDYSTIKNYVFDVVRKIRQLNLEDLSKELINIFLNIDYSIDNLPNWALNSFTKKYIKHYLARITNYIEEESDKTGKYAEYVDRTLKDPYEIEHITPDHYEWYTDEYDSQEVFDSFRNNIGDLVLLPKSINASLNDSKYDVKIKKYCSNEGNILSASLDEVTYINNTRFVRFVKDKVLNFEPYKEFGRKQIELRNKLYLSLAKLLWSPNTLLYGIDEEYIIRKRAEILEAKQNSKKEPVEDNQNEKALNKSQKERLLFWNEFNKLVEQKGYPFNTRKASTDHWYTVAMGVSGIHISITLVNSRSEIGVSAHIANDKSLFEKLLLNKDAIESELGFKLEWKSLEDNNVSDIIYYIQGLNFDDHSNYEELMNETIDKTIIMRDTFRKYLS